MASRTNALGFAHAGSQRQTQIWVNERPRGLRQAIVAAVPDLAGATFDWRSPLAADAYREYRDGAFLHAVGLGAELERLKQFWPSRGPVWDALAVIDIDGRRGVLLGEGKSYPAELYGGGCKATPDSRRRIEAALQRTQAWLGVERDVEAWCGPLYQTANRLAHLYWLREVVGVPAWFVHLLFVDDEPRKTTEAMWETALLEASTTLGLPAEVLGLGHVCLEAAQPSSGDDAT